MANKQQRQAARLARQKKASAESEAANAAADEYETRRLQEAVERSDAERAAQGETHLNLPGMPVRLRKFFDAHAKKAV